MTATQPATRPAAPRRQPVVVALGANALLGGADPGRSDVQRRNLATAVRSIADLAADHDVVVAYGSRLQGVIGHLLEEGLGLFLPGREVVTLRLRGVVNAAELRVIRSLVAEGVLVICTSRGGTPVVVEADATPPRVVATADQDLVAALLATCLGAEALVMLTDVDAVQRDWGTPDARPVSRATPDDLGRMAFAEGSMGPKVRAACRFVEATGGLAAIGALADARALLDGRCGTTVQAAHSRLWADCDAARSGLRLVPAAVGRSLDAAATGGLSA
jgi:carbamate kinase